MVAKNMKESRKVVFSKTKACLFKKANELSILCGAEVAILAFSIAGKPYSYGYPSFDLVANRFLHGSTDHQHAIVLKSSSKYENCMRILEVERKRKAELENILKSTWFGDENLDTFDLDQLDLLEKNLVNMKTEVEKILEDSKSLMNRG